MLVRPEVKLEFKLVVNPPLKCEFDVLLQVIVDKLNQKRGTNTYNSHKIGDTTAIVTGLVSRSDANVATKSIKQVIKENLINNESSKGRATLEISYGIWHVEAEGVWKLSH